MAFSESRKVIPQVVILLVEWFVRFKGFATGLEVSLSFSATTLTKM